mmetsp:Transcript_22649/g.67020  ORF Transcript_22649/g.67020 Transcript_22649/m.67020 type:complete len:538 (-) Transcript_22649:19-1632(-)
MVSTRHSLPALLLLSPSYRGILAFAARASPPNRPPAEFFSPPSPRGTGGMTPAVGGAESSSASSSDDDDSSPSRPTLATTTPSASDDEAREAERKNGRGSGSESESAASASAYASASSAWPPMILPPASSLVVVGADADADADATDGGEDAPSASAVVPAVMNYVSPSTTSISTRRDLSGSDSALIGAEWAPTVVNVRDARRLEDGDVYGDGEGRSRRLTLRENGFELRRSPISDLGDDIDFFDQGDVVGRYYPLCERLVADALAEAEAAGSENGGAPATAMRRMTVRAFDHNVRSSASNLRLKNRRGTEEVQNPAGLVHADYTAASAPRRLGQLCESPKRNDVRRGSGGGGGGGADEDEGRDDPPPPPLLDEDSVRRALSGERRYAVINVWRNVRRDGPVLRFPLACVDAASVRTSDLRTFRIHYADRVGENYFACHPGGDGKGNNEGEGGDETTSGGGRAEHRWYYYSRMNADEALLLKQWDSAGGIASGRDRDGNDDDGGESTFAIHSAFDDPTTPPDAPDRTSIEVRCAVIWE